MYQQTITKIQDVDDNYIKQLLGEEFHRISPCAKKIITRALREAIAQKRTKNELINP
ncbi:MAG: hypothetical protein ACOC04_02140 [Halothece sp.]